MQQLEGAHAKYGLIRFHDEKNRCMVQRAGGRSGTQPADSSFSFFDSAMTSSASFPWSSS